MCQSAVTAAAAQARSKCEQYNMTSFLRNTLWGGAGRAMLNLLFPVWEGLGLDPGGLFPPR